MATAAPGFNPAYILDPSLYGDQQSIAQQQALAQALMQEGITPMQGTQMAGQVALKNSPTQSMAKIAALLSGQSIQKQSNQANQELMQRQSAAMAQMFGMGQQQPQGPSPASAAMGMGATQGSVGPTQANAQLMGSMAPAQQAPQRGGPMSVSGAPAMTNMMSYMSDPTAHMKAVMDQYAQTPEMKMAAAAYGIGTPGYMNALREQVQKAGYIAPAEAKAGNLTLDRNNNPIVYNPNVEKGVVPKFSTSNGFTGPTSADVMPGYEGAVRSVQRAEAAGKQEGASPFEMVEVKLPDGRTQMMTRADAARYYGSPAQPPAQPPAQRTPTGQPPPQMPGRATGQSTTDKAAQDKAAEVIAAAPAIGAQAKQSVVGLQNALEIVESGLKSGKGTPGAMQTVAVLNNLGIPLGKTDADNYQSLQKYLQNSLNQAAQGTGATGSDARFDSFMKGQPNAETMSGKPLANAIRYVLSQQDAAIARANFIGKTYPRIAGTDPNAAITTQQTWTGLAQPKFFEIQRMHPAEQAAAINSLSPQEAKKFIQWRQDMGEFR